MRQIGMGWLAFDLIGLGFTELGSVGWICIGLHVGVAWIAWRRARFDFIALGWIGLGRIAQLN